MPWKLEDIEIDELSLVEAGANKKKFLFRKADEINGTLSSGYLICPECDHKEAITDFLKNAGEECPECGTDLIESDAKLFFKGEEKMDKFLEIIQEFIGEDEIEESVLEKIKKAAKQMSSDVLKALKSSLNILNKYKNLMPDDVKSAIDVLAKAAAGAYGTAKADDDGDVKKAGAKISKTTLDLIKKVIESAKNHSKAIQGLEMLLKNSLKKAEGVEELEEKLEEMIKKLDKIEKGKASEDDEDDEDVDEDTDEDEEDEDEDKKKGKKKPISKKVADKLDEIAKRLEKVEKQKGVKKSLTGDEDEVDEDEDEDKDTAGVKKGKEKKHQWGFTIARKREKQQP